jgi:lipopolysaccharide biosynthesis glycosyltransferase
MTAEPPTLHLACAADRSYVAHSAAMIHSVLGRRGPLEVEVHYLHGPDLPHDALAAVAGMVDRLGGTFEPIEVADERIAGLPTMPEISAAMWYRIFLPELLPEVDKVLYLDADTIAVDSLAPLWAVELGEALIGAVTNVFQADHLGRPQYLGLAGPEVYFNSGVLLMNLAGMRSAGSSQELLRVSLANHDRLEWPDQDALNIVLGGRRLALAPRWNVMNSTLAFPWAAEVYGEPALAEAVVDPAIRHFEGPSHAKPWHLLSDVPMRKVYFEHRRQTPWPRVRREGVTPLNLVKKGWRRVSGG